MSEFQNRAGQDDELSVEELEAVAGGADAEPTIIINSVSGCNGDLNTRC